VQSQSAQPRNALLHRWFGYTGKPWLTATAVATLVLLLLAYGGFVLYASLNRTTEPQPADEARSGGGGGASTGTGNFANNGTTHHSGDKSEEFHLPRPTPVASIANIPVARPQATPNIPTQTPVHETVPKPATTGLVAGRWTGSYTSCTDGSINTANMSLSESAGTDASKLIVSGRLNIVTDSGVGNCSINGTYTKKANRLFLRAACGSKVSPEYLSATHANSLSLGGNQDQLTGVILPDSPCVTVSFTKK